MTLDEVQPGKTCRVHVAASTHPEMQSRLYALGMFPGALVQVLRLAPAGDPMQVKVGSTLMSIRRREAELVEVAPPGEEAA